MDNPIPAMVKSMQTISNSILEMSKSMTEFAEYNEKRFKEQQTCMEQLKSEITSANNQITSQKAEINSLKADIEDLRHWEQLIEASVTKINELRDTQNDFKVQINEVIISQNDIAKQVRRQNQQLVANSLRMPIKSPSTYSVFDNAVHSNSPRHKVKPSKSSHMFESLDANDELSVISDQAEHLKRNLDDFSSYDRSDKNSMYFDD